MLELVAVTDINQDVTVELGHHPSVTNYWHGDPECSARGNSCLADGDTTTFTGPARRLLSFDELHPCHRCTLATITHLTRLAARDRPRRLALVSCEWRDDDTVPGPDPYCSRCDAIVNAADTCGLVCLDLSDGHRGFVLTVPSDPSLSGFLRAYTWLFFLSTDDPDGLLDPAVVVLDDTLAHRATGGALDLDVARSILWPAWS